MDGVTYCIQFDDEKAGDGGRCTIKLHTSLSILRYTPGAPPQKKKNNGTVDFQDFALINSYLFHLAG